MNMLLAVLALSFGAHANPFAALKEMLRADPPRVAIAPCEDDYSCVQVDQRKVMMDVVELKRDGYEIVAVAKPGQPGLLLIRTHQSNRDQLILILKDGGQIYAFNPAVDDRPRAPVATEVIQRLHTPALKRLFEARTEDQLKLRAEVLAHQIQVRPSNAILDLDWKSLYRDGLVPQEVLSRLNVLALTILSKSESGTWLTPAMRKDLKALQVQVQKDLIKCGFAQTCASGA